MDENTIVMAATSQKRSGTTNRIRQGIKDGCMVQLLYCAVAWGVIFFIKPYDVELVLGDADPAVTAGAI